MLNRFAAIAGHMTEGFGMRAGAIHIVLPAILAMCGALAVPPRVALAQESYAAASPPSNPTDEPATSEANELSPEESAFLGSALNLDPIIKNSDAPAKTLRLTRLSSPGNIDIKRTELPDGSSSVAVKQPLPIDWDAHVGADLGLAPEPSGYLPGTAHPNGGSGAAWASVGVLPSLATVDARVDSSNDQGKLGTTFKHTMPLGNKFAVTVQNSYSVTETFNPSVAGSAVSSTPAPQALSQSLSQVWGNEKAAKFDILPTGTTLGAGLASTSTDPVTHHTLSAEQKLYGSLHVTTAVTDIGQPISSKSITAGFKLNW
jgi:hypothetical protein